LHEPLHDPAGLVWAATADLPLVVDLRLVPRRRAGRSRPSAARRRHTAEPPDTGSGNRDPERVGPGLLTFGSQRAWTSKRMLAACLIANETPRAPPSTPKQRASDTYPHPQVVPCFLRHGDPIPLASDNDARAIHPPLADDWRA
jgi:hypothetical protein